MPKDLVVEAAFRDYTVLDRDSNELPFSKGILATSILATGADTPRAYDIAEAVQRHLIAQSISRIDAPALTALTAEMIATHLSQPHADRYLMWQKARQIGRPIIVSLLGASGVGKSTLATRLALRLNINQVVTTDALREVLRTVIPASVLPELHVSSYESIEMDLGESQAVTYQRQARAVVAASVAVARRCVIERKNALFEGVHLLPGSLTAALQTLPEKPIVVEILLVLHDRDLHNRRLLHRQVAESGRDGSRHLARFEVIRNLQETMRSLATRAGIREFDIGSEGDLTQLIAREIVDRAFE